MTACGTDYSISRFTRHTRFGAGGLSTLVLIVVLLLTVSLTGCNDKQATQQRAFAIDDFQWKELIQALYTADFETAKAQSSDQVLLMLLYIKDMNDVFSDPTMSVFFGNSKCFTQLYEPKLNAMLETVVWGEQMPTIIYDVVSLLKAQGTLNTATVNEKYPFLGSILGNLRDQIPQGRIQQLVFVMHLRQIFRDRAKKDALMLFTEYGCDSEVTHAVYKNAVRFVELEPLKVPSNGG